MDQRGFKDLQTLSLFVVLAALTIGAVFVVNLVLFAPTQESYRHPASSSGAVNPAPVSKK